jgi:ubiquinone biosynthesis protein
VDGIKISRVDELREAGYNLSELASNGAQLVFKMIIDHRFFHADPHPGNLFALPGNRWAPVDFGMVGHLSESAIDLLSDMLIAATKMDAKGLVRVLATHDLLAEDFNAARLELDLTELLYRYHKIPLKQVNMRAIFNDARNVFTRHRIRLPSSLTLLVKAIVTYEEVGRMLDPHLNMIEEVEPHVKKLAMRKLDPMRVSREAIAFVNNLSDFVAEAPAGIRRLTQKALRGELGLLLRHKGLDKLATDIDRASNRLSFSLIIAAIIVGSSLLITSKVGTTVYGFPLLGVVGYLVAAAFGIWLVISIIRSGRF